MFTELLCKCISSLSQLNTHQHAWKRIFSNTPKDDLFTFPIYCSSLLAYSTVCLLYRFERGGNFRRFWASTPIATVIAFDLRKRSVREAGTRETQGRERESGAPSLRLIVASPYLISLNEGVRKAVLHADSLDR